MRSHELEQTGRKAMDRDRNHHLSWGIKDVEFDEPEETEESSDPVIENLKAKGLPITRENYIRENWGDIPEFLDSRSRIEPAPLAPGLVVGRSRYLHRLNAGAVRNGIVGCL